MDKYTMAVTGIPCPRESCTAAPGQVCKTTAVVHHERRDAALAQGLWDPGKALAGEYGDLAGCPLEALKPARIGQGRPDQGAVRRMAGRYPAQPGAAGRLLLCDGCFQAATGLLAGCQDGCPHTDPDHDGLCLRDSPTECQWCGTQSRLHEVPRAGVEHRLPTVGEEDEGVWWLHFTDGTQGPFCSARAAWGYWHGHADGQAASTSEDTPREVP